MEQSTAEQVNAVAQTRGFSINYQRVVKYRSQQAVEFFQLLKLKSVALDQLFFNRNLWLKWRDEDVPANIAAILIALRDMGVIFYESANQFKSLGMSDGLIDRLCKP